MKFLDTRGETIVEVLLSTAVLATILAGAFTLSNRATRINQTANERTEVNNILQSQAELLKLHRSATNLTQWRNVLTFAQSGAAPPNTGAVSNCVTNVSSPVSGTAPPFYLDIATGVTQNGVATDRFYIYWIQGYESASGDYIDFFINACWEGIGDQGGQQSGLVVRLLP